MGRENKGSAKKYDGRGKFGVRRGKFAGGRGKR